jgi:hypothetical protein
MGVLKRGGVLGIPAVALALGVGCAGARDERSHESVQAQQLVAFQTDTAVSRGHARPSQTTTTADEAPRTIDSFGFWSLLRLGAGPIEFSDVEKTARLSIRYNIEPDRARQGPGNWYLIRLHARVLFGEGTGHAWVSAGHNGYVSALIEYEAADGRAGRRIVRRAASYIDGSSTTALRSSQDELRFRNVLQYDAVQAGLNQLTFSVRVSGLEVKRVEILPDSGIEYTRQGPAQLRLTVRPPSKPLKKGQRAPVTVEVRNVGDRPVRGAVVSLEYAKDDLRVLGSARRKLGTLPAKSQRRIAFQMIPLRRGEIDIGVFVGGIGANHPGVSKTLNVR